MLASNWSISSQKICGLQMHKPCSVARDCTACLLQAEALLVAEQGIEESGIKLAVLTCLARMLEIKVAELEGEGGTGPLERDERILEAAEGPEGQLSPIIPLVHCA